MDFFCDPEQSVGEEVLESSKGCQMRHALNGREKRFGNFYVDGWDGEKAYEFFGCAFHGCPKCFRDRSRPAPFGEGETMDDVYRQTLIRLESLRRDHGVEVEVIWECELREQLAEDPKKDELFHSFKVGEAPLHSREAFVGGRTNAVKLLHFAQPGEKILYRDVTSLYPWSNKRGGYPVGHATVFTNVGVPDVALKRKYRGLVKCAILAPQDLFLPLLPTRVNGKLLFVLCAKCAATNNQKSSCSHDAGDRMLRGTWTTLELYKALDLGYELLQVSEVWHFDEWAEYDGKDPASGLFSGYIDKFLKLKTEASGWPSWVKTEEDKDRFVLEFEQREGIRLEPGNMAPNAAMRCLSKMMLNSFWGKFGQRDNMLQTTIANNVGELLELIRNPEVVVENLRVLNDSMMECSWVTAEEFVTPSPTTNCVIAAFTTSIARLKLYSFLEVLGKRVLYFDTDSVIYTLQEGEEEDLPIGTGFLGELTDELAEFGENCYISSFVSGGAKNYSFKVCNAIGEEVAEVTKVKGIKMTSKASRKVVHFEAMERHVREFVAGGCESRVVSSVSYRQLHRDKEHVMTTRPELKRYGVVYDKRRVLRDYGTEPFGWKDCLAELTDLFDTV